MTKDCWTCKHNWKSSERDTHECDPADTSVPIFEWAMKHASDNPQAMPQRNGTHPDCPGYKPKEAS